MSRAMFVLGTVFLAQLAPPEAAGLHSWLTSAVAVMGAVYLGILIFQALKRPERVPSIDAEFATNEALEKHETADNNTHRDIFSKIGGVERGAGSKLGDLATKVAALDERTATTNSTLHTQGLKIDRILERLKA